MKFREMLQRATRAAQQIPPQAGGLCLVTDEKVLEQWTGVAWEQVAAPPFVAQVAKTVFAGPASGADAAPAFRQLAFLDLLGYLEPFTVPYSAGNFTAQAGAWTVDESDVQGLLWVRLGKLLFCFFSILYTDVSSTPTYLRVALPAGFVAAATVVTGYCSVQDAGAAAVGGLTRTLSGAPGMDIIKPAGAPFTATSSDNTHLQGFGIIPVQ